MKEFDIKMELMSLLVEKFDLVDYSLNVHGVSFKVRPKVVQFCLGLKNKGAELVEDVSIIDKNIERELNMGDRWA